MESIIFGKPIVQSVITLKVLLNTFKEYTKAESFSEDDAVQYEETLRTIDLLHGSIAQVDFARSAVQTLVDKIKIEYDNMKNKEDKKSLLQEIENTEKKTKFTEVIREATELSLMLGTRLTEAESNRKRLARKLGITINSQNYPLRVESQYEVRNTRTSIQENYDEEPFRGVLEEHAPITPTIPAPRINMPKFYGKEEEFPEFWATYETLVHNDNTLTTVEKMLLLKDSLRGRSDRAIKGIQLVPQNYDWMIKALKKKYGSKPANRARIVRQLNSLQQADKSAQSNEYTFDKICMLLNQMSPLGKT